MKNSEILQKLTLGKNDTETIQLEYEDQNYEFTIRPLTDGELTELQSIEKKSLIVKIGMKNGARQTIQSNMNDVDINTGEFTKTQNEAMYQAVAWSLSTDGEEIDPKSISELPTGLPGMIFTEVIRISQLSDDDLTVIKQFRKVE